MWASRSSPHQREGGQGSLWKHPRPRLQREPETAPCGKAAELSEDSTAARGLGGRSGLQTSEVGGALHTDRFLATPGLRQSLGEPGQTLVRSTVRQRLATKPGEKPLTFLPTREVSGKVMAQWSLGPTPGGKALLSGAGGTTGVPFQGIWRGPGIQSRVLAPRPCTASSPNQHVSGTS